MPNAILMHKDDKLGSGQLVYKNTAVEYGDDGISGLLHNVPVAQNEWAFTTSGTQTRSDVMDATTKRVATRVSSAVAVSETATLAKRVLLPRDYGSWPANGLRVITRRHQSGSSASLTLYGPGGTADAAVNGVSVLPVADDTYEQFVMSPSGLYVPGDFLTLVLTVVTTLTLRYLEINDIEMIIRNKRGNI